ncbi:MAG: ABC transporter ATP-binding protein [Candidatus Levybacteria bacterium]|nr:ABC transporter ATP-binding protein [Candidatus Levybacteria bacterium]
MQNILEVKNLTKKFGQFTAVDNISFSLQKGEVLGLLGPNGAGKTTTIHLLLGLTLLNSGKILYFGKDFLTHKEYCLQKINFSSAFNTLQGRISVLDNLLVFAYLYGIKNPKKKILELCEYFEISDLLSSLYWNLSSGEKTRTNIVKSLLNDPELLLMDEPTASLDPDIADKTLSFIESLRESKKLSILYTSHDMNEVTRVCDRVVFLDHGRIVMQDTPLNLTRQIKTTRLQLTFDGKKEEMEEYLQERKQQYSFLNNYIVSIETDEKFIPHLIFGLTKTNIRITDIDVKKPTLEDVFIQIARGGHSV